MKYLLLLFLVACDNSDPTWMLVCEDGNGFHYADGNGVASKDCADPKPVMWPGLPIRVGKMEDPDYQASLDQAISFWNDQLDTTIFVTDEINWQVFVGIGSQVGTELGATSHYREGTDLMAKVELRAPGDTTEAYYVLAHELGHAIGLAHDPGSSSIMNPIVPDTSGDDFPFVYVTDNDKAAILEVYK